MMKKSIIFIATIFLFACQNEPILCKEEGIILTNYSDGTGNPKTDLFIKFYLCDSILKNDTINMNLFKYQHYDIENNYISINLPTEYKLKRIERKTIFYLYIWNNSEFGYQFLKLKDINFSVIRDLNFFNPKQYQRNIYFDLIDKDEVLEIERNYNLFKNSNNTIYYPKIHSNSFIKKKFKSFSDAQICDAIKKEIENEKNIHNLTNPQRERDYWLRYCNQLNKIEFLEINSNFKINYHETYLILDLEHKSKAIKKILKYDNNIGN